MAKKTTVPNPDNAGAGASHWRVITSVVGLVCALIGVFALANLGYAFDCNKYFIVPLIYPFFFGAVGVILGGQIALKGDLRIFSVPWAAQLTGGIAAALLGYVIAVASKPDECAPRHTLAVLGWPVRYPSDQYASNQPRYYTTVHYSSGIRVEIDNVSDNKYDYIFSFSGDKKIEIRFQMYRLAEDGSSRPIQGCAIEIQPSSPPPDKDYLIHKITQAHNRNKNRFELEYDEGFLKRLEAASNSGKSISNTCLTAFAHLSEEGGTQSSARTPIESPLYMVSKSLGQFASLKSSPDVLITAKQASKSEGLKDVARGTESETVPPELASKADGKLSSTVNDVKPPLPSPSPPLSSQESAACPVNPDVKASVDLFLSGDDLDAKLRQDIYGAWIDGGVHCYVWKIIELGQAAPVSQARAIRLLNYALKNIDKSWQVTSEVRRDFGRALKPMNSNSFRKIFDLVKSDDDAVRAEAVGFIRYYPVDGFEQLFKSQSLSQISASQRERLATAASFLYYNRIVENLNEVSDKGKIQASINEEFSRGQKWTADGNFKGTKGKSFAALLLYGKGAVERWKGLNEKTPAFSDMLQELRKTSEAYPSRFHHVAQAVGIVDGGVNSQEIIEAAKSALSYPDATFLDKDPTFSASSYELYAGPGSNFKTVGSLTSKGGARMLLRSSDWVLVHSGTRIGWIRRKPV